MAGRHRGAVFDCSLKLWPQDISKKRKPKRLLTDSTKCGGRRIASVSNYQKMPFGIFIMDAARFSERDFLRQ